MMLMHTGDQCYRHTRRLAGTSNIFLRLQPPTCHVAVTLGYPVLFWFIRWTCFTAHVYAFNDSSNAVVAYPLLYTNRALPSVA